MRTEIGEQPAVVARLATGDPERYREVCAAARASGAAFVLYVARGTSDNAAVYGQYLASVRAGLPSGLVLPSATTLYHADLDLRRCLVIGISQSGETPDVAESLADARSRGAFTVAITNDARSPLAQAADFALPTEAGVERAVAATKTYTSQLAVLALLWASWSNDRALVAALREEVPQAMAGGLEVEPQVSMLAGELASADRLLVVARGYNLATGLETALKVQETAAVAALPYSAADLMHGPIAMLAPGLPVLCFAPAGATQANLLEVTLVLRDRGARVVLIAPEAAAERVGAVPLASPAVSQPPAISWIPIAEVPEAVSPLVAIIPGQLLACRLAIARGRDPDRPAGLTKVTHTR
ncbi:MAG TPA: SIS domain-containing protein [Verrucomicrobiae bacterium]|nr:SIS domain-containing protein [Verrucomicrobiae bacterium]